MPTKYLKNIKPGEIWIVELSIRAGDTIGHETQKTRPCLVIANSPVANMITIIPLQSNLDTVNFPYTHLIKKNQKNKLKNDSVAVIFQIRSLDRKRFRNFTSIIDDRDLSKIKTILKDFFQL
jgi:mRNA-degrading endonuclease toxin of MazEF toxin-antitoxin module